MFGKYAPLLLILACVGIAVPSTQVFGEGNTSTVENGVISSTCTDSSTAVKSLAKKAWQQAKGPTDTQYQQYQSYLNCSLDKKKLIAIWHNAKIRYKHIRYIARLNIKCKDDTVIPCIRYASALYNQSYAKAYEVAYNESRLSRCPSGNPTHFGLYQFDWDTWQGSPYDDDGDICSARFNSLAAMWYWHRGETSRWTTY